LVVARETNPARTTLPTAAPSGTIAGVDSTDLTPQQAERLGAGVHDLWAATVGGSPHCG